MGPRHPEVPQLRAPTAGEAGNPATGQAGPLPAVGKAALPLLAEVLAAPARAEAVTLLESAADMARHGHPRAARRVAEHAVKVLEALSILTNGRADEGDSP